MKLLFDENLSHRLFEALSKEFPGSTHVPEVGLGEELAERLSAVFPVGVVEINRKEDHAHRLTWGFRIR